AGFRERMQLLVMAVRDAAGAAAAGGQPLGACARCAPPGGRM
ncbi:MAG: hypothetical protein AVDCRST_MAG65-1566, partial [uncultured Solirubrobacteraceae bacterium]